MKNKILTLVMGLFLVMVVPATFSCVSDDTQDACKTEIKADNGGAILLVNDSSIPSSSAETAQPVEPISRFSWLNIVNLLLIAVSTFFALRWRRLKQVLKKVSLALEDNKITKEEVKGIVKGWRQDEYE